MALTEYCASGYCGDALATGAGQLLWLAAAKMAAGVREGSPNI